MIESEYHHFMTPNKVQWRECKQWSSMAADIIKMRLTDIPSPNRSTLWSILTKNHESKSGQVSRCNCQFEGNMEDRETCYMTLLWCQSPNPSGGNYWTDNLIPSTSTLQRKKREWKSFS